MSLIHRNPFLTEKELAARRVNARKSTGPRTSRGKARMALNGLKHGGYVVNLREKLAAMEDREALAIYDKFARACTLRVGSERDRQEAERLAALVWCAARPRGARRVKPASALESIAGKTKGQVLFRIRIKDPWQRLGVTFWRQQRRYALANLLRRTLLGSRPREAGPVPMWGSGVLEFLLWGNGGAEPAIPMEDSWRVQRYRMRPPSSWEGEKLKWQAISPR
ncbi:MAG: hypothetical protein ACRD1O_04245 [Terriglobia bacterium]